MYQLIIKVLIITALSYQIAEIFRVLIHGVLIHLIQNALTKFYFHFMDYLFFRRQREFTFFYYFLRVM